VKANTISIYHADIIGCAEPFMKFFDSVLGIYLSVNYFVQNITQMELDLLSLLLI